MRTNESIRRLAGSLVREHAASVSFGVAFLQSEDLGLLATQFELMGCRVDRHAPNGGLRVPIQGGKIRDDGRRLWALSGQVDGPGAYSIRFTAIQYWAIQTIRLRYSCGWSGFVTQLFAPTRYIPR